MRVRLMVFTALSLILFSSHLSIGQTWQAFLDSANAAAGKNQYERALSFCERGLAVARAQFGEIDSSSATLYHRMGLIHRSWTGSVVAESLLQKSLNMWRQIPNANPSRVARTMTSLAAYYVMTGDYRKSEPLFKSGLEILERYSDENSEISRASTLNNMGNLYWYSERYDKAIAYISRSIALYRKYYPPNHGLIAALTSNLAVPYARSGNFAMAEAMHKQALQIHTQSNDSTEIARTLNNLAVLYQSLHRNEEADSLFTISEIYIRNTKYNVGIASEFLLNYAQFAYAQGNYSKAEFLAQKSLEVAKGTSADNPLDRANAQYTLGKVLKARGILRQADSLLLTALDTRRSALGEMHTKVTSSREALSLLRLAQGRLDESRQLAALAVQHSKVSLGNVASFVSESAALEFSTHSRQALNTFLTCDISSLGHWRENNSDAANAVLEGEGFIADNVFERKAVFEQDSATSVLAEEYRLQRLGLSQMVARGPSKGVGVGAHAKALDSLKLRLTTIETRLASASSSFRTRLAASRSKVDLASMLNRLPTNSILLEFLRFDSLSSLTERATSHYLVVVIPWRGVPTLTYLGQSATIDTAINVYRSHLLKVATKNRNPTQNEVFRFCKSAKQLYKQVLKPIEGQLQQSATLFIAPDGALNLISFATLMDEKGKYLIERHPIHYLSAGRDLIRISQDSTASGTGLLALGDPDYDATALQRLSNEKIFALNTPLGEVDRTRNVRSGCEALSTMKVKRLPNTKTEVDAIAKYFPSSNVFDGREASEENFKKNASGRKAIHVATHGYFISGECQEKLAKKSDAYVGENPLLQSGLFLAGANLHGSDIKNDEAEDGIVTALEVSAMDLRGTDLVVLSACETGLGKVEQGEGVYGLRRAFQMAGAKTVVSSLWKIPDSETAKFMKDLYANMNHNVRNGVSHSTYPELMQKAALSRIRELRLRGQPTHPYSWGAFVATGDWRIK
jgi:CHAT domain-containing protein/tetratricopeptide (TPR) repeat protein